MLNSIEIWKDIEDFEGYYEVSSLGRIRNSRTGLLRRFSLQGNHKYYIVNLWKNNVSYSRLVHRIVAKAFIPNPNNKPQVNHLDKNGLNNDISNLEWVTCSENHLHAFKNGRVGSKSRLGEKISLVSKFRYVYWDSNRSKWKSSIKVNGKNHNIGRYNCEIEAAKSADNFIKKLGLGLILNFN